MGAEFWNERFSEANYIYGKEPNVFFKHFIDSQPPGKIFLPGEGEGRNAVYAAKKGWEVTAFDQSLVAMEKAIALSKENNVQIEYLVGDFENLRLTPAFFDAIALIFFHLPPDIRMSIHRKLVSLLKPSGKIIIESFSKNQLGRNTGGPQVLDLLYDTETLSADFSQLNMLELFETIEFLDEGPFHHGDAALTRMIGQMP